LFLVRPLGRLSALQRASQGGGRNSECASASGVKRATRLDDDMVPRADRMRKRTPHTTEGHQHEEVAARVGT
jgi:hypothetical protein